MITARCHVHGPEEQDLLVRAYKKEKRAGVKERIHIVCMVKVSGLTTEQTAELCYCDPHTVTSWLQRYDEEGIAGLADRPRPGRPPKVVLEDIEEAVSAAGSIITPLQLRERVRKKHGVTLQAPEG